MKKTVYLIVNSQNGETKVRQHPSRGANDFNFKVLLEIPSNPLPVVEIKIPVPVAPAVVTEVTGVKYGIPWAVSEGLIIAKGLSNDGKVNFDFTDEGIKRLWEEAGKPTDDIYSMYQYARLNWGIDGIYFEGERLNAIMETD